MRIENLAINKLFETPSEATLNSHKLSLRGGYLYQTMQGVYTYSPIGWKVLKNISKIIKSEMDAIGCQEMYMPMVSPAALWKETNRYDAIDVLLKFKSRAGVDCCLNPTHEEIITDYVRGIIQSYKQLPFSLYQVQTKYRDELRARGGLIRTREFMMKDAYSFNENQESLDIDYQKQLEAYHRIFKKMGFENVIDVKSDVGDMGGSDADEFMYLSADGEDTLYICGKCGHKSNKEVFSHLSEDENPDGCPKCKEKFTEDKTGFYKVRGIEVANIFKLGEKYTKSMGVYFLDKNGKKQTPIMGCYGIGVSRCFSCLMEEYGDDKSIVWPLSVAPFKVHLIGINLKNEDVKNKAEEIYSDLISAGIEVIFDDKIKAGFGEKMKDADLIGAPIKIIISPKTLEQNSVEIKCSNEVNLPEQISTDEVISKVISAVR